MARTSRPSATISFNVFMIFHKYISESTENEGTRSLKSKSRISRCITSKRSATYGSYILKKRAGRTTPSPQYKKS